MVFEISKVTFPSHPGSRGVTLTIIPHLAYVDFPKQIVRTFLGILKYSILLARAKLFAGTTQTSPLKFIKDGRTITGVVKNIGRGGLAEVLAFDEDEKRLANWLAENPSASPKLREFVN